ncbi:hypothetical protein IWQ61_003961 [Dispira simplex]|nr:hypothetical protein IWQ61_003961 [Dispira simplex]
MSLTLRERISRFEPAPLGEDVSHLHADDRAALVKLVEVCKYIDMLYYRQAWKGNEALRAQLEAKAKQSPEVADQLLCFELNRGPWDRTTDHEPFIPGVPAKPPMGANFYPEDLTREEWDQWLATLSSDEEAKAKGFYHIITRGVLTDSLASLVSDPNSQTPNSLRCVPYSEAYSDLLVPAAELLKSAGQLVQPRHPTLARFLEQRAESFLTNDYLTSELAWLRVEASEECPLEITCGPYEVYTDTFMSYKAAFEMYIHWRDAQESERLETFKHTLPLIEQRLPVPDVVKRKDLTPPPIVVVNELMHAGDVAVPMTAAYNLPNDEEAVRRGGSRLTIIKNVQEQKYEKVLFPIADLVVAEDQISHLSFDAFFTHVLLHEVAHSNGPQTVVEDLPEETDASAGKGLFTRMWDALWGSSPSPQEAPTVRSRLQELYSTIEEAKADITGLFAAAELIDEGIIKDITLESFYVTFLASAFRSIRFGLNEAHGRGQAIQLNYLLDKQAFEVDEATGKFRVNFSKMREAVRDLTHDLIMHQARGNKANVEAFVKKLGILRPHTEKALEKLAKVPVDIRPKFTLAELL